MRCKHNEKPGAKTTSERPDAIEDDGRGIPIKEHAELKKSTLEGVMTVLKFGGKFRASPEKCPDQCRLVPKYSEAFSNGTGGKILIGVSDDGTITGLSGEDIRRLNQLISNTAGNNVQPAINPITENIMTEK